MRINQNNAFVGFRIFGMLNTHINYYSDFSQRYFSDTLRPYNFSPLISHAFVTFKSDLYGVSPDDFPNSPSGDIGKDFFFF